MNSTDEALRAAVLRQLAMLEDIAEHGGPDSELLPIARTELQRLTDGWRLLLEVHHPGTDSRCQACPGSLRHRRWPCGVWLMAYRHLLGEGPPRRRRKHFKLGRRS
jgi:hypothetical protein